MSEEVPHNPHNLARQQEIFDYLKDNLEIVCRSEQIPESLYGAARTETFVQVNLINPSTGENEVIAEYTE
jgi:hypothetical protein